MVKQVLIAMALLAGLACYEPRQPQVNTGNPEEAPNPFSPSTTFYYEVTKPDSVYIVLFDQQMNLVDTLLRTYDQPGKKHFRPGAKVDTVRAGLYFYKVQIGDSSYTKKCVLLK